MGGGGNVESEGKKDFLVGTCRRKGVKRLQIEESIKDF